MGYNDILWKNYKIDDIVKLIVSKMQGEKNFEMDIGSYFVTGLVNYIFSKI